MTENFCKDCIHCTEPEGSEYSHLARCSCSSVSGELDYFSGETLFPFCQTARRYLECGPEGFYFERRD